MNKTPKLRNLVRASVNLEPIELLSGSGTFGTGPVIAMAFDDGDPEPIEFKPQKICCSFCGVINRLDYSKLPAVYTLCCAACGGPLE